MKSIPIKVLDYCAEECRRQESGELSVARMCKAWLWLQNSDKGDDKPMTWFDTIMELGHIIEPDKNQGTYGSSFRQQPVTVRGQVIPVYDFERLVANITGMCAVYEITPEEWYKEFEKLHPFNDGNGRVGSLMYNYLQGTMHNPVAPPDVFANKECDR